MLESVGYEYSDSALDEALHQYSEGNQISEMMGAFDNCVKKIDRDPEFARSIGLFLEKTSSVHRGIDDQNFKMRFQTYAYRDEAPSAVFAALYAGFSAASQSDLVVGVNILGPENGVIAIRDYRLHMHMFRFLRKRFPNIRVSMHAGELALGMIRPEGLIFHVSEAVEVAGAHRIGHGVGIMYEPNSLETLATMARQKIAVEINLTSNQFILGVQGAEHPILVYHKAGVPLVISTDDPGVSRNNLSNQYMLLASRYSFSYPEIKEIVLNSIRYSFLSRVDREQTMASLTKAFIEFEQQSWQD